MRYLGVLLFVIATTIWPSRTSVAAIVPQADQGLSGGWAIDDGGHAAFLHSLSGSLDNMYTAGAGWVRVVFRLGACYADWTTPGCDGRTALQAYDGVVASVRGRGLQILGVMTGESWNGDQTAWTANNAETVPGGTGDNAYVQAFAPNAASVLARHFNGQVGEWEVWNEPNAWTSTDGNGHFSGGSYLYPSNYAWLLHRSNAAVKAASPTSRVVFGGLFGHDVIGVSSLSNGRPVKRGDMPGARRPPQRGHSLEALAACVTHAPPGADSGASYLCATYSVGEGYLGWSRGTYPLDDIGQHLYVTQGGLVTSNTLNFYMDDLRQAYLNYEGASTAKRTQITELGWATDRVTPQVQASNVAVAFQTLRTSTYVHRAYWFFVQDVPEAGLYFGLVDTNATPKPAFSAYQQYATYTAGVPCSPRPPVVLSVAPAGTGVLQVTLTAGSGNLASVDFQAGPNALISIPGRPDATGHFSVSPGTPTLSFSVRRTQAGPVTVILTATDACGAWPTFVGGGATAF